VAGRQNARVVDDRRRSCPGATPPARDVGMPTDSAVCGLLVPFAVLLALVVLSLAFG
jgi:hypothetical protein